MNAKETLQKFVPIIDKKLEEYWRVEASKNFGYNEKQKELVLKMIEHAGEHSLRSSKRLRGAFTYYGYMLGRPVDDRIWNALHEKDCRGKVSQVVDAQILDFRQFAYSPEPLAQIPYMRLLEVSGEADVWFCREQVLATTEAG